MPRRSKKRPQWFTIKEVLDERTVNGKTEYLVDWEGTDRKGKPWPPSWSDGITADQVEEWENKKKRAASQEEAVSLPGEDSDVDRPLPPAKRAKTSHARETPPITTSSTPSPDTDIETPRSLRSQNFACSDGQRKIAVLLTAEPAIDRSEYLSVSTTQSSSQLVSELEEEDSRIALASQISHDTIPDSQEQSFEQLLETRGEASAVEETQDPEPNCPNQTESLIIPDSQDLSLNRLTSEESSNQVRPLVTPLHSQGEVVPNSGHVDLDIPSRQVEQIAGSQLSTTRDHKPSPRASVSHTDQQSAPAVSASSTSSQTNPESDSDKPVFFTQPLAPVDLPFATSSSQTLEHSQNPQSTLRTKELVDQETCRDSGEGVQQNVQESTEDGLAESTEEDTEQRIKEDIEGGTKEGTEEPGPESLQPASSPIDPEPQAAQIVPREFDLSLTEPHETGQPDATPAAPLSPRSQAIEKVFRDSLDRISPLPASQRASTPRMDSDLPRSSAVDDLRMVFGIPDAPTQPDVGEAIGDDSYQSTLDPTSQKIEDDPGVEIASIMPGVVIQSPGFQAQSQPPVENDHWNADLTGTSQFVAPESISPASLMKTPHRSAVNEMLEMVDLTFGDAVPSVTSSLLPDISVMEHATISPAQITKSVDDIEDASHTLLPLSDHGTASSRLDDSSGQSITMGQIPDAQDYAESSSPTEHETTSLEYVVTLPFQASRRPFYDDVVFKYKPYITEFGHFFSSDIDQEPSQTLVQTIDELFGQLLNICDYPQDLVGTTLEELPTSKLAKYVRDANPKFSFVFEFLKQIKKDTEILIVTRAPELLRLLFWLTESLELGCIAQSIGKTESEYPESAVQVRLSLTDETHDPFAFDVVIGFDNLFDSSPVAQKLSSNSAGRKASLILRLVTTHSIEHIGLHIPRDISALERRNGLLLGIVKARKLVQDPSIALEPHEAAEPFVDFVNGMSDNLNWEPQTIPDDVLDIFANSQARTQMPTQGSGHGNGLKRKLDDDDIEDDEAKRMRVLPNMETTKSNDPPLPNAVRQLLKEGEPKNAATSHRMAKISVPVAVLEALAEKFAEQMRQSEDKKSETDLRDGLMDTLQKQVREFQRTTHKVTASQRQALEDRSRFETEARKAEAAAKSAVEQIEQEKTRTRKRISELETRIDTLTAPPEGSEESPLKVIEKLLKASQEKVQALEQRLKNANNDSDYIREQYQEATARAGALGAENRELRERVEELEKRASDNMVAIHRIQRDNTVAEYARTIANLQAQVREKDMELGQAREELRVLRNGRPQTRQASVPRSPRTSMMSPRTGRGFGGSASRGTSPAPVSGYEGNGSGLPGMQFMGQQPGNSRWGHLRD